MSNGPFQALRKSLPLDTAQNTPSPPASPTGFTSGSAWSDDDDSEWGLETSKAQAKLEKAGQLASPPKVSLLSATRPNPIYKAQDGSATIVSNINDLKSVLQDIQAGQKGSSTSGKGKDASQSTSQIPPTSAPQGELPPSSITTMLASPSKTHAQAKSALELLGKFLDKMAIESIAPPDDPNQGQEEIERQSGSSNPYQQGNSYDLQLNKALRDKKALEKELQMERAAHAATIAQLRGYKNDNPVRSNRNNNHNVQISKEVITDIALKLTEQGPSAAALAAGMLFDEISRVAKMEDDRDNNWSDTKKDHVVIGGWVSDKDDNREARLGLTQRLTSIEGVMDVTLGRVSNLEIDLKRVKGFME